MPQARLTTAHAIARSRTTTSRKTNTKDKISFTVKPDAKNIGSKYRGDFVNKNTGIPLDILFHGVETADGKYIENVSAYDPDNKRYKNGCKNRRIMTSKVDILTEEEEEKEITKRNEKPIINPVRDHITGRIVADVIMRIGESDQSAAGNIWRFSSSHKTRH